MLCLLLISIRETKKEAFRVGASRNLESCWKVIVGEAHRDGDGGEAGGRNESLGIVAAVLFIGVVKRCRWVAPAWKNKGVDIGTIHRFRHGGQQRLPARVVGKVGAGLVSFCRMDDLRFFTSDRVQNASYICSVISSLKYFHYICHGCIVTKREEVLVHIVAKPVAPVTRLNELLLIFYVKVYNLGAQLTQIGNSIIEAGKDKTIALTRVRVGAKYSETFA